MGLFSKLLNRTPETKQTLSDYPTENKAIEQINGFELAYHYENVNICLWNGIVPDETKADNKIVLIQEKKNKADPRAILLLLVPQKKKIGYIYRGKLQDMVNDYLEKGDKVTARISDIQFSPYASVKIDIAFFKKSL